MMMDDHNNNNRTNNDTNDCGCDTNNDEKDDLICSKENVDDDDRLYSFDPNEVNILDTDQDRQPSTESSTIVSKGWLLSFIRWSTRPWNEMNFDRTQLVTNDRTTTTTTTTTTMMNTPTSSSYCCCGSGGGRPFHRYSSLRCWYGWYPFQLGGSCCQQRCDTYLMFGGWTKNGGCCLQPPIRKTIRHILQYSIRLLAFTFLLLWLGVEYEQYHVRNTNTQQPIQQQSNLSFICGMFITTTTPNHSNNINDTFYYSTIPNFHMETYPSVEIFHEMGAKTDMNTNDTTMTNTSNTSTTNTTVITAHCGNCGKCSNPWDIQVYDTTKTTLFTTTTKCAKYGLLWGRRTARQCMMDHVDLSNECNECWVENIMCDLRKCIFTCLWYGLFSQIDGSSTTSSSNNNNNTTTINTTTTTTDPTRDIQKSLNPCTMCDETRCGPQFLHCAGANRRRCGIKSDIERDNHDVCTLVQPQQWWTSIPIQEQYQTFIQNNTTTIR